VKAIKVPIENEVLDVLHQCIPFKMELQYRIGKYRLDAFIPRLMLGIQIDEGGHQNYNVEEEKEYDEVVRDHNIVCIRFNPDAKYLNPPGMELVRLVWERTLSPDFMTFREKFKLV
jgi:very-short-patch-repair endonuclease